MRFNGLPLSVVESRCEACPDKTAREDWRCTSATGFLGRGERLLEVVARDAEALGRLGTTRERLGERLGEVVRVLRESGEGGEVVTAEGQILSFRRKWFVGTQWSPFCNEELRGSRHNEGWSQEWRVSNPRCPRGYRIVLTEGTAPMLSDFGFLQGGLDGRNRYRIDPDVASCILAGTRSPQADGFVELRRRAKNEDRRAERERLRADMAPALQGPDPEAARAFLEEQLKRLADK